MGAPKKFVVETECINQLMSGAYELTVRVTVAREMRLAGIDLTDVHYVGTTGRVVRSDMLGNRGLWVVRGETLEGILIELTVAVVSVEYDVELLEVQSVKKRGGKL